MLPVELVDVSRIREGVATARVGAAAIWLTESIAGGGTIRAIIALALGEAAASAQKHCYNQSEHSRHRATFPFSSGKQRLGINSVNFD
jgi:hypothetical protein